MQLTVGLLLTAFCALAASLPRARRGVEELDCLGLSGRQRVPSKACAPYFIECHPANSRGNLKDCDDPMTVFDKDTGKCEDPDDVVECRPPFTPGEVDCEKSGPGNQPSPMFPCSSFFVTCLPDNSFITQDCAAVPQTKYDEVSDKCLYPEFVPACGGNSTTPEPQPTTTTRAPLPDLGFDCTLEKDGNYENPKESCSNLFVVCSNGQASTFECPASLAYDQIADECLLPAFVESCGGNATTRAPPTTPPVPDVVDFDCSQREEGNYPVSEGACANYYVTCVFDIKGKKAIPRPCPGKKTFYDADQDKCNSFADVPACQ